MLARGVPVPLTVDVDAARAVTVRVRQAVPPGMRLDAAGGRRRRSTRSSSRGVRGRHGCPPSARARPGRSGSPPGTTGRASPPSVCVYPDLPAARRLALSVRQGRFRDQGISARGPLGLGTEFELVRDYLPDDDIRQVNWRATARLGRPMSNQYRDRAGPRRDRSWSTPAASWPRRCPRPTAARARPCSTPAWTR